jgi:hypothetical protein
MIKGVHTMFYSSDAEGLRNFIRDKLGFSATDAGEGWLIFDIPEADMGCHPTEGNNVVSGTTDISFYCDNIRKTIEDLQSKKVEFTGEIEDHGYGLVTYFKMPGNIKVQLYEPKYRK